MTILRFRKWGRSTFRTVDLAFGAFFIVFANFKMFAVIATVPLAIGLVASVMFFDEASSGGDEAAATRLGDLSWWLWKLLSTILGAVFAVAWHRFILLGRRDSNAPVQFRLGSREAKFFLYLLLLTLPFDLFDTLAGPFMSSTLGDWSRLLIRFCRFVVLALIWIRFSFIFPALSVNADRGLGAAWRQTRGVSWRIFWAYILVGLVWGGVNSILSTTSWSVLQSSTWDWSYVGSAMDLLLDYLGYAAMIGVVSLAYKRHSGWTPHPPTGSKIMAV